MSRRITLTDFDAEQVVKALKTLQAQTNLDYEIIKVGRRYYDELIAKIEERKEVTK